MSATATPDRRQDHGEILALLTAYVFGLDRRDFTRVASVFTEDAVVQNVFDAYLPEGERFSGVTTGGRAVAEGARKLFGSLDATQHLLGAQSIELTETGAHASTQIVAHHHRGSGHYHTGGTYEDDLVRTPDGWRISRRTLHIHWTTGSPDVVLAP
ncbi:MULTISPECIES: nuclear transport factor 2 family protein [Streptomyces]|uniref:Nuclear transport factor 2 family protein n=1 Tax=Streptomyces glycanivorans TaxID=3033808 RepID=A0ABY9J3A6_9ACTN|nr:MULTISPECIES: nuclear transport factor 2 family protein [unclassified Streptomyces]WSQ75823.1 nuclear transport factor 2 family protein [Streptomyces sp. NBC_01213]TXS12739.1 nuclear transport factor 2 family protein [Streptomyces sp. wa22]WLQ62317.1 nuclear transport factor 2 family protein [Streptomyces sp. Alt3]WSQ83071.1 nuclear transport factor 2 family protein [Streptomyces sp. NBC_01212]WSR10901.1 nuclear transport factor 2 family protein [Streptomyces sp. NBC_01208]